MSRKINLESLVGSVYGQLTIISYEQRPDTLWVATCKCSCGNLTTTRIDKLRSGRTISCGCKRQPNLVGQVFGKLSVMSRQGSTKDRSALYMCRCECGGSRLADAKRLRNGSITHCGCIKDKESTHAKGEPKPSPDEAAFRAFYRNYRSSAKERDIPFLLTAEDVRTFSKQPCNYCGKEPSQTLTTRGSSAVYTYNGIDRMDSSKGYILSNCVPCCKYCNYGKRDLSPEQYLEHCKTVVANSQKKCCSPAWG